MVIYLGADHRGFYIKEQVKAGLKDYGYRVKNRALWLGSPRQARGK